jgi:hypothetical protein
LAWYAVLPPVPVVGVAVAVFVRVAVARTVVAVAVARTREVAVAVARTREVAVAVARTREVAVAVRVAVAPVVGVAVADEHVPLFTHQLSVAGVYGEFGGQSRLFGIGAIVVYFDPLNVTDAPLAYAVQLWNAGSPAQLTCAEAVLADTKASRHTLTTTNSFVFIRNPFEI